MMCQMLRICSDIYKLLKNALFFDWLKKNIRETVKVVKGNETICLASSAE